MFISCGSYSPYQVHSFLPSYLSSFFLPHSKSVTKSLSKHQRDFWWGVVNNEKKLHFTSWATLTKPKFQGGLGIRDPHISNLSLMLKLSWRFFTESNSICAIILWSKYLHSCSFWDAKPLSTSYYIWASTLKSRDFLHGNALWSVGDGSQINIWQDPWVPIMPNHQVSGYHFANKWVSSVCDLINRENFSWKENLILLLFPPHEAAAILKIPL